MTIGQGVSWRALIVDRACSSFGLFPANARR